MPWSSVSAPHNISMWIKSTQLIAEGIQVQEKLTSTEELLGTEGYSEHRRLRGSELGESSLDTENPGFG